MNIAERLSKLAAHPLGKIAVQFFKFGMVGVLNTAISLAVYYIFLAINEELYLVGNVAGFVVSTLNAYFMNHKYVFGAKGAATIEKKVLLKTYLAYGFSLLVSTELLYLFVNFLQISEALAPLFCLMVTVPMNYIINRLWVYKCEE